METNDLLSMVRTRAQAWLDGNFDEETKKQVRNLLENDEKELTEAFYRDLEFGTGGLRGIMGPGTNRMNIYTVGMATQGLCNYLLKSFGQLPRISVAIAYDCRNNSRLFAETAAGIFSANGIKVYLFSELRPTPELSFAIRHYGCQSGVVITASHNPREYNGFKAYWDDGAQVIEPHDRNIIGEVQKIHSIDEIKNEGKPELIEMIGEETDRIYTGRIRALSLSPEAVRKHHDLKIVYTPIHGTGVKLVPMVLRQFGFSEVFNVPEQDINDGDFPTVHSPNPEEKAAMSLAIEKAKQVDAEIIMATDPDSDRVGIGVKDNNGEFILLNGNQTASILIYYLLRRWSENNKLTGREYIVKTIVTTGLLDRIAEKYKVESYDVLTGFKYIAEIIRKNEGKKTFIGGGEESYGYLAGEFVRDKDAVMSCALIAEAAAWAKDNGKTLYELLLDIYIEFGLYRENLLSVTKKGKEGAEEIQRMMETFRNNTPESINGSRLVRLLDYEKSTDRNLLTGAVKPIELPCSNVLQFILDDGSKISIRPSGTEPKIKFYFSVPATLENKEEYESRCRDTDKKIEMIINDLKI
ncbi:MAG: phospho-sugar mutase [Bacteroidota bacterium]